MLGILRNEGWDLKERELTKLRKEQGLLLREANKRGYNKRKRDTQEETADQDGQDGDGDPAEKRVRTPSPEPGLSPEIIAKRQAYQARLIATDAERFRTRNRRRRTKVWAGIPPDPEQPPRYPSELTMEESKRELGLDKPLYQQLRKIFENICRTNDIIKKTLCGPDTWKGGKEELIGRMPHLQPMFWGPGATTVNQTQRPMALDLICMDVTKKIRTVGNRVTITDAKNILGVTPQEGREIRAAFDALLKGDHFTSKLEVSRHYWDKLKAEWIEKSPLLQERLGDQDSDPDYGAKLKSLESIACDVQKRHRDEQTKKDPTRLRKSITVDQNASGSIASAATSPSTANRPANPPTTSAQHHSPSRHDVRGNNPPMNDFSDDSMPTSLPADSMSTLASEALANASYPSYDYNGMQIDPSLLEAAYSSHYNPTALQNPTASSSVSVYFRNSPNSSLKYLSAAKKLWLDTFHEPHTVSNLRELALNRSGLKGITNARVGKIEGVQPATDGSEGGKWGIDEDDELEAYLGMVEDMKKNATFIVEIL